MVEMSDLSKIAEHCEQVSNSPYIRRDVPPELANLRAVLETCRIITKVDVPALITEIKRLRSQNKRLEAEKQALSANSLQSA